jgi:BASS family bile acid:Na+ symporter
MTVERLINIVVTVTLIELMIAIGVGVSFVDLARVARDWRLVMRAILANYVCVPAATVALLLLFEPHPMVAVGFLVLAACPGAPYGPPFTAIAKGNVEVAVGLMVLLAASSAIVAPLLLHFLPPLVSSNEPPQVGTDSIVAILFATQLLPLCVGMSVRQWRPVLADRLQNPANVVSKVLNLLVVGFILVTQFHFLAEVRPRGFVGMILLLLASWAAGWLLSTPANDVRKAMAVTTSLRNFSVGVVIATNTFAGTSAVTAVVAFGLVSLLGTLGLAVLAHVTLPAPTTASRVRH